MTADLSSLTAESSSRRAALVARLETEGVLTDPRVREALLRVRREVLLPHAYLRVSGPAADPIDWRLLDGSHPDDREEWLDLVHEGDSVLLQRDGEPLDALGRGPVTGGHMTSMSSGLPFTVEGLQTLQLAPAQRFLDLGTGPGIALALAATITGPGYGSGVEGNRHMAVFAQRNLDRLAFGVQVVTGDALDGDPASAPYDRVHSGFGVPCVPSAWVDQLAPGGRLLTTLTTVTPSWPGQLLITRTPQGRIEAVLRGGLRGTRPLLGYQWLTAGHHRSRIDAEPGRPRATRLAPPQRTSHGFWLAASYLAPGLMWDIRDDTMRIVTPDSDSWAVPGPEEGTVRVHGPRDVWAELEALHDRWERAGRPDTYRVDLAVATPRPPAVPDRTDSQRGGPARALGRSAARPGSRCLSARRATRGPPPFPRCAVCGRCPGRPPWRTAHEARCPKRLTPLVGSCRPGTGTPREYTRELDGQRHIMGQLNTADTAHPEEAGT